MLLSRLFEDVSEQVPTSSSEKKNTEQPIGMSGDKRVNVTQQSSVTVGDELLQGGGRARAIWGRDFLSNVGGLEQDVSRGSHLWQKKYIYISGKRYPFPSACRYITSSAVDHWKHIFMMLHWEMMKKPAFCLQNGRDQCLCCRQNQLNCKCNRILSYPAKS